PRGALGDRLGGTADLGGHTPSVDDAVAQFACDGNGLGAPGVRPDVDWYTPLGRHEKPTLIDPVDGPIVVDLLAGEHRSGDVQRVADRREPAHLATPSRRGGFRADITCYISLPSLRLGGRGPRSWP